MSQGSFSPLSVAVQQGHRQVAVLLLEAEESSSKVEMSAVHIAARKDDAKALRLLLSTGQEADAVTKACLLI